MRQKDFVQSVFSVFFAFLIMVIPGKARAGLQATHVRIYGGAQNISPTQLNDHLQTQGLDQFKNINMYGMEVGYRVLPRVNLGLRVQGKWQQVRETASISANAMNPYFASLQQSEAFGVLRIALIESKFFLLDFFGGGGVSNLKLDVRTASGEGSYEQSDYAFASTAGASAGFGWGNVYLFFELGQESMTFTGFKRLGTTSSSIDKIDGSGSYAMLGLAFTGIPGFVHLNGSSKK